VAGLRWYPCGRLQSATRIRLEFIQQAFTVPSVSNSFMSFNKGCDCRKLKCVNDESKPVTDRHNSVCSRNWPATLPIMQHLIPLTWFRQ